MSSRDLFIAECLAGTRTPTTKEVGTLVDYFKVVEAERLKADKRAAELKAQEVSIKTVLINAMNTMGLSAVGGDEYVCEHRTVDEPTVKDWDKFYAYILKTKDFSLLERRPGKAAVKERWSDGKEVPGVIRFPVDKLSFTRTKG